MSRIGDVLPEFVAEVVSSLSCLGHSDLADQLPELELERWTHDPSLDAVYLYLSGQRHLDIVEENVIGIQPGDSIEVKDIDGLVVVDTDHFNRIKGIEVLWRKDLVGLLKRIGPPERNLQAFTVQASHSRSFPQRIIRWLFAPQLPPIPWWRVILWWELRRIPFNIMIGVYGIICLFLFFWAITTSGILQPGEDAVESAVLLIAPFFINVFYTLGCLVELSSRHVAPMLSPCLGPWLMKAGLGFSFCVISLPALYWMSYRLLQVVHVVN